MKTVSDYKQKPTGDALQHAQGLCGRKGSDMNTPTNPQDGVPYPLYEPFLQSQGPYPTPAAARDVAWFERARLGLFIHWNHCTVAPAEISWVMKKGSQTLSEYQELAKKIPIWEVQERGLCIGYGRDVHGPVPPDQRFVRLSGVVPRLGPPPSGSMPNAGQPHQVPSHHFGPDQHAGENPPQGQDYLTSSRPTLAPPSATIHGPWEINREL